MDPIRILGLDPGLRNTGWGIITIEGSKLSFVACGVVTSDAELDLALAPETAPRPPDRGGDDLDPHEVAVEETFVNKDAQATLKLGQARAMSLLVPAMHNLPVAEYGANQVKKTVVGVGHADKNQVLAMVKILLPKADPKKADAADALAIAICHAHQRKARALAASY